jgi:hypothetical protein
VSDLVLDASLALQWFLEDESGRQYGLSVLASLSRKRAVVPILWFYEVGNGLLMALALHGDGSLSFESNGEGISLVSQLTDEAEPRRIRLL